MAEEFTNGAEIDAVHDQSTGKSVPVAMPGKIRKLCCCENTIKPISLASQLPSGGVEEDPRQLGPPLVERGYCSESGLIERNVSNIAILGLGYGQNPPFEIYILPLHPKLLPRSDSGVNANEKRRYVVRVVLVDVLNESLLLAIGEKANASVILRLLLDFGGRIESNFLILDSDSEDEGNGCLPAIEAGKRSFFLISEVRQKTHNLLLADTLCWPVAEVLAEDLELESVVSQRIEC